MKKIPAMLALIGMSVLLLSNTAYAFIGGLPRPINLPDPPKDENFFYIDRSPIDLLR